MRDENRAVAVVNGNSSIRLADIVKGQPVLLLEGHQPVTKALETMDASGRRAVGVALAGRFAGIFTNGDFVRRVVMKGRHPGYTSLIDVMTANPVTITPDVRAEEAFELMFRHGYSHLPVLAADRGFLGIVSQSDLRDEIARSLREKTQEARLLRAYVAGESYGLCASY